MERSLKPVPAMAQVLPGFFFVAIVAGIWSYQHLAFLQEKVSGGAAAIAIFVLFLAAWIVGSFFDGLRNVLEDVWDRGAGAAEKEWWKYFLLGPPEKVEQLHEYYYSYYQLDVNFVSSCVGLIAVLWLMGCPFLASIVFLHPVSLSSASLFSLALVLVAVVFWLDARALRKEMKQLVGELMLRTNCETLLPHEGVYTQLVPSDVHKGGVGLKAIRRIPKGTVLFAGDQTDVDTWVSEERVSSLSPELQKLYTDFCIYNARRREYGCPKSLNQLTMAWYVNCSKAPNLACDPKTFELSALRDIEAGEELTADYATYCDEPPGQDWRC
jgi:hypothetical protein